MLYRHIEQRVQAAVQAVLPGADAGQVLVRPCPDPKFGDYQCAALMALAKQRKLNPRQLAEQVLAKLDVSDYCEPVTLAGAGFLNFRLQPSAVAHALQSVVAGHQTLHGTARLPRTVVIDFSSPNVAKPMHVGHIRSTGIGDALQRVFRLLGHRVISDNHLGDWGTQFGKLIVGWKSRLDRPALERDPIGEMERLYKCINDACESDASVMESARQELVRLQAGDAENLGIWREMIRLSQAQFDTIYRRLGVRFDHTLGESFYNPWLAGIVTELLARGIARESEGAVAVFSDGSLPPKEDPFLTHRDGEWAPDPALIRKGDGGFNYTTTDLATLDYRIRQWSPAEILYVVDDRQSLHFRKLFLAFARWQPGPAGQVKLRHIGFGKILGEDGKPFKTRSGDTVKLGDLLDEAEERALRLVRERQASRSEAERLPEALWPEIARVVGLGAVKYADLLPNRQSDYVFSWDKMLALQGNTAPYLLYAHARIRSIFRKAARDGIATGGGTLVLAAPEEVRLAAQLLNFGLVLEAVAEECRPNYLCNYLYDLSSGFTAFYENCPVLQAGEAERDSRLLLCDLTARVLRQGLETLGIETLERM